MMDSTKVHLFILRLISDNPVAEQKLLPHKDDNNERLDYLALKQFYEGVGANSKAILAAEKDLVELFYAGEKKPHMWWDEFESRLINAFAIIDKDANRVVYTDNMKFRTLNNKIQADFLTHMRTIIQMEVTKVPMTMNFAVAMTNYRNCVNDKFPQDQSAHKRARRIQATNQGNNNRQTSRGQGGRFQRGNNKGGRSGGRGHRNNDRRRKGDKGNETGNIRKRDDELKVTGIDGTTVTVHPAYQLENDVWFNLPETVRHQLT